MNGSPAICGCIRAAASLRAVATKSVANSNERSDRHSPTTNALPSGSGDRGTAGATSTAMKTKAPSVTATDSD